MVTSLADEISKTLMSTLRIVIKSRKDKGIFVQEVLPEPPGVTNVIHGELCFKCVVCSKIQSDLSSSF